MGLCGSSILNRDANTPFYKVKYKDEMKSIAINPVYGL